MLCDYLTFCLAFSSLWNFLFCFEGSNQLEILGEVIVLDVHSLFRPFLCWFMMVMMVMMVLFWLLALSCRGKLAGLEFY